MDGTDALLSALMAMQRGDGSWSYRPGGAPSTEATAFAAIGLLASGALAESAVAFLLNTQRGDGSFAASPEHDEGNWATAPACMALAAAGQGEAAWRAATWLAEQRVFTLLNLPFAPYGYDTALPGYPWTPGDFSWVEPTAMATLALKLTGSENAAAVSRGEQFLLNRRTSDGGWNYGEPRVLGAELSGAVAPTAWAVLALQDTGADLRGAATFLNSRRDGMGSLLAVAWAINAMVALGEVDEAWEGRLAARWEAMTDTERANGGALGMAVALLATAETAANPLVLG
jgi:hypothetical protein